MADPSKLTVAIAGAGIAGLTAAIALLKHPGINVHIYERAIKLQEIGASIALGPNGMRTLEKLGIENALDDSIAIRNKTGLPMIYRHWKTNEIVSVDVHKGNVEYRHRTSRFYRVHLQQALLEHVPSSSIHLGKAFAAVSFAPSGEIIIQFQDGTSTGADILLGADGIHSAVRRHFIPASVPKWTGWVAFRSVFDEKLVGNIEDGLLDEANHWWGPERTFFSSRLGKGLFTIVGGYHSDPNRDDAPHKDSVWNSDGDVNILREYYKHWHPVVRKMIDATPYTRLYPNASAAGLETWGLGNGRVTLAGDAAHAHGGAFAAGGSLAIDDAFALALALWHVFPPASWDTKPSGAEVAKAIKLYEQTRKPHTDRVLSVVHQGNEKTLERVGKPESDEEVRTRMKNRADPSWLHEHDVEAAFLKVLEEIGSGKRMDDRAML